MPRVTTRVLCSIAIVVVVVVININVIAIIIDVNSTIGLHLAVAISFKVNFELIVPDFAATNFFDDEVVVVNNVINVNFAEVINVIFDVAANVVSQS